MGCGSSSLFVRRHPKSTTNEPALHHQQNNSLSTFQMNQKMADSNSNSVYCPPPSDTDMNVKGRQSTATRRPLVQKYQSIKVASSDIGPSDPRPPRTTESKIDFSLHKSSIEDKLTMPELTDVWRRESFLVPLPNTGRKPADQIESWQSTDVVAWLTRNGLEQFKGNFENFDGRKLLALHDMYTKAPGVYFKEIKRFLDKPGLDAVLQVTSALGRLCVE